MIVDDLIKIESGFYGIHTLASGAPFSKTSLDGNVLGHKIEVLSPITITAFKVQVKAGKEEQDLFAEGVVSLPAGTFYFNEITQLEISAGNALVYGAMPITTY